MRTFGVVSGAGRGTGADFVAAGVAALLVPGFAVVGATGVGVTGFGFTVSELAGRTVTGFEAPVFDN